MKAMAFALLVGFIAAGVVGICYTVVLYNRDDHAHAEAMAAKGWCIRHVKTPNGMISDDYAPCEASR